MLTCLFSKAVIKHLCYSTKRDCDLRSLLGLKEVPYKYQFVHLNFNENF